MVELFRRTLSGCWMGLEPISESYVQVDGIHGKGYCIKVFLENVIQSPRQVGMYIQMLEGTPFATQLQAPLEFAELIAKVVGGNAFAFEVDP